MTQLYQKYTRIKILINHFIKSLYLETITDIDFILLFFTDASN